MKIRKLNKGLSVLFTLCLAFLPLVSTQAAALIDIGLGGSSSSNVRTLIDTTVDADAKTQVNANTSNATSSGSSSSAGAAAPASTQRGESVSESSVRATVIDAGLNIRVLRSDIKDKDEAPLGASLSAKTAADGNADAVILTSDLEAFAQATVASDGNVEEVNFSQDTALLSYKQQGKLLGIFPVTFTVTAIAHADGNVEVQYPWYAFVVAKDEEALEAELEAAVAEVRAEYRADAEARVFSASEQARAMARMHTVLKAHLENEQSEESKEKNATQE